MTLTFLGKSTRVFLNLTVAATNWILATGTWNDSGVWSDTSTWVD